MKKRFFTLLTAAALILTLMPATALAAGTKEVGSGMYDLTEVGLKAAIADAGNGDTIKFIASGTITMAADIIINKSITLDLNGQTVGLNFTDTFDFLSIPNGYSVTVKGPGTITTNTYIESAATLTVQGDAVIEGTGDWQTLRNYGTVSMTGGALRQTNGNSALINAGTATFDTVTIETSNGSGSVIWTLGTLTLNNCTTRNNFSGTMTGTNPSVISVSNSGVVTLNGGSVTAPSGGALPAIEASSTTTLTNNGATITGGYVKKLGGLSVSVSSGAGKVTLAPQMAEPGVTYYYKTTSADDSAGKPSYNTAFNPAGWTAFSGATDIATASTATVYVQVVKVGDSEQKIYGWGQGSATPEPAATPTPSAGSVPAGTATVTAGTTTLYVGGRTTLTPEVKGGLWQYDQSMVSLKDNGDGIYTVTALKSGQATLHYTIGYADTNVALTIKDRLLPQTGQDFTCVYLLCGLGFLMVMGAVLLKKRAKTK